MKVLFGSFLVLVISSLLHLLGELFCSEAFGLIWHVVPKYGSFHSGTCESYLSGRSLAPKLCCRGSCQGARIAY